MTMAAGRGSPRWQIGLPPKFERQAGKPRGSIGAPAHNPSDRRESPRWQIGLPPKFERQAGKPRGSIGAPAHNPSDSQTTAVASENLAKALKILVLCHIVYPNAEVDV